MSRISAWRGWSSTGRMDERPGLALARDTERTWQHLVGVPRHRPGAANPAQSGFRAALIERVEDAYAPAR